MPDLHFGGQLLVEQGDYRIAEASGPSGAFEDVFLDDYDLNYGLGFNGFTLGVEQDPVIFIGGEQGSLLFKGHCLAAISSAEEAGLGVEKSYVQLQEICAVTLQRFSSDRNFSSFID